MGYIFGGWMIRKFFALILVIGVTGLYGCSIMDRPIKIIDARIVTGVDDKLMPVDITDVFPAGTAKVSCWFKWQDAKINTQILVKWHYVTDDVHILDYDFNIPKKDGMGSVSLTMPEGKTLPAGSYKVDLILDKNTIRSLAFKVE
jgi:hypothetical protein